MITGLGSLPILTPGLLCLMPAVVGCFARQCESDNYRPLFPVVALAGSLMACCCALFIGFGSLFGPTQVNWIWNHPGAHVGVLIGYVMLIGGTLGVIRLPVKGVGRDCLEAALLGLFLSVLVFPAASPYAGLFLINGDAVWSVIGVLALTCGIAVTFCTAALVPYVLKLIFKESRLLWSVRIGCVLWLLGPFALSIRDFAATSNPSTPAPPPLVESSDPPESSGPSRIEYGIDYLLDVEDGIAIATKQQQPLLFVFTAVNAINCRLMAKKMQEEHNRIRLAKFVRVQLLLDKIPMIDDAAEQERLLKRNLERYESFGESFTEIPAYAIASPDGKTVLGTYAGMEPNEGDFADFLDEGWKKWEASQVRHSQ